MSSMRNAVQRRNHRERGQPEERSKWGLLEKHKDYSARAKDFNAKKTKLRALKQKVLERNPDEFYFGMLSKKGPSTTGKNTNGTLAGDRGSQVLSQDAVRLFKTQDLGYVRTMRNKTAREVEGLEERIVGLKGDGRHIVYVDDEREQMERIEAAGDDEETEEIDEEEIPGESQEMKRLRRLQKKETEKTESRLEAAQARLKALTDAEEALDLQRSKMAKSQTVGGITKKGIKFKVRERKR